MVSILLVMFVVYLFLRDGKAALIPSVAVPLVARSARSARCTCWAISLNNFSLMALIVATGFVVDNAIVVLENITRHVEQGMPRLQATLLGAREVAFTVLAMSISLMAVFLPILLMGGIIGRFFNQFAMVLSVAIVISLIVSLTTTPMLCALLDLHVPDRKHGPLLRLSERGFEAGRRFYGKTLEWSLENPGTILFVLFVAILLNFYLYFIVPKGFFPTEDTGQVFGGIRAGPTISFQLMETKFKAFMKILSEDPAVESVNGLSGGGGGGPRGGAVNTGNVFIQLKPLAERGGLSTDAVIQRVRTKLGSVTGARLFLQGGQDVRAGGRQGNGAYQYTVTADTLEDLEQWMPKITDALQDVPELEDVNSDRGDQGLEVELKIDRATAARLGLTATQIDNTLYDAFGQRQVSTIYNELNQYHVVMEVAPQFWQSPETLNEIYVSKSGGSISGTQATRHRGRYDDDCRQHGPDGRRRRGRRGAQSAAERAHQQRTRWGVDRRVGDDAGRDDGAALCGHKLRARHCAACDQSPGAVRRDDLLVQPAAGDIPQPGDRRDPEIDGADQDTGLNSRRVRGHRQGVSAIAVQRAVADRHGDPDDLHRPGGSV